MKPIKIDVENVIALRAELIEKLEPRLRAIISGQGVSRTVSGFKDEKFVEAVGPGLHRLSDRVLINFAIGALIRQLKSLPPGETGIPELDDIGKTDSST